MTPLDLAQRLGLHKFFSDGLAALRKGTLVPDAQAGWPAGTRMPIMFGGQHAGWASMPKPSTSAAVADEAKLLAWLKANAPDHVATVTEVKVTAGLIEYLAEHAPEHLVQREMPDQHWTADVCAALKSRGYYVTRDGEKLTEVPGITVSQSDPSPRVDLSPDGPAVIAAALRDRTIPVAEFLALPAPPAGGES